jgi:hypothetical protein
MMARIVPAINADQQVVRDVVRSMAGVLFICVAGILALAWAGKGVPDVITNIASGALGSLGTLLASTRSSPERVVVANPANDPVPVDPTPSSG